MRSLIILLTLAAVVAIPFVLKPSFQNDPARAVDANQVLTIITPHSETTRHEFTVAFRRHMLETEGREIFIDWRAPGGTSEIEKIVGTEFTFAFQRFWTGELKQAWSREIEEGFNNRRLALPDDPTEDSPAQAARRAFLGSSVGIRMDLFFGGGSYPFIVHADQGHLVDSGLFEKHPNWFDESVMPIEMGGEPFYDPQYRWIGACLSTFGICYNELVMARLGLQDEEIRWELLADPRMFSEVALGDPSKSGGVTKAFEMIIQQAMRTEVDRQHSALPLPSEEELAEAVARGWTKGLQLIQRISANARYFTHSSNKIPADVAQGNAAAGMCIDYYGRTLNEQYRRPDGTSRVHFVTPLGGSSTGVDPIALFRGAPNDELARKFIEFCLSPQGQKIWGYRAGTPGGPVKQAIRRLPVRRDFYTEENRPYASDPEVNPYEEAEHFHYEFAWTGRAFSAIRFIIRAICLDPHEELREAWLALIANDFPPEATEAFHDVSRVSYEKAMGEIGARLGDDPWEEVLLSRELGEAFRDRYQKARRLAEEGR